MCRIYTVLPPLLLTLLLILLLLPLTKIAVLLLHPLTTVPTLAVAAVAVVQIVVHRIRITKNHFLALYLIRIKRGINKC